MRRDDAPTAWDVPAHVGVEGRCWMVRSLMVAVLVICSLTLSGCASQKPAAIAPQSTQPRRVETAQQIASRLAMRLTGKTSSFETTIPATLEGAQWGLIQSVAAQGGYDLRPYVGKRVTLRSYDVVEKSEGHRQRLFIIELDSRVIGAYIVVDDVDPGISGVGNPS